MVKGSYDDESSVLGSVLPYYACLSLEFKDRVWLYVSNGSNIVGKLVWLKDINSFDNNGDAILRG